MRKRRVSGGQLPDLVCQDYLLVDAGNEAHMMAELYDVPVALSNRCGTRPIGTSKPSPSSSRAYRTTDRVRIHVDAGDFTAATLMA